MCNDLDFEVNGRNGKTLNFIQQQYPSENNRGAMTLAHKAVWPDGICFVQTVSGVSSRSCKSNKEIYLKSCVVVLSKPLNIGTVGCGGGPNEIKWNI